MAKTPKNTTASKKTVAALTHDVPPEIAALATHFRKLQEYMLPRADFQLWQPRPTELARLEYCLQFGDSTAGDVPFPT